MIDGLVKSHKNPNFIYYFIMIMAIILLIASVIVAIRNIIKLFKSSKKLSEHIADIFLITILIGSSMAYISIIVYMNTHNK